MSELLEIEDALQERNVFVSGIDGRPTHSDSYMTVISPAALDKAWEEIKDMATKEKWFEYCDYWMSQGYLTPILKLLGLWLKRKAELL